MKRRQAAIVRSGPATIAVALGKSELTQHTAQLRRPACGPEASFIVTSPRKNGKVVLSEEEVSRNNGKPHDSLYRSAIETCAVVVCRRSVGRAGEKSGCRYRNGRLGPTRRG